MLKRFFIAKSFRFHRSKPKKIPGNIFFDISKVRKSSRRGLLGRQNYILSDDAVPENDKDRLYFTYNLNGFVIDSLCIHFIG